MYTISKELYDKVINASDNFEAGLLLRAAVRDTGFVPSLTICVAVARRLRKGTTPFRPDDKSYLVYLNL